MACEPHVASSQDYDELTEQALSMRDELVYTRHELRAFKVVHRSTAGKLRRRLGRKTDRLKAVESKLGNDPDRSVEEVWREDSQ